MKAKKDYILRKVGKQYVLVATGRSSREFHGMIRLDESAAYVFELLKKETTQEELVSALMSKYPVEEAEARSDIESFIAVLKEAGALE